MGITPQEVLYIGDSNTDMKTGINAGMETVGVLWGFRDEAELRENGAKYIVRTPQEILKLL
jgi:phosphoglycolate phosphatase